MIRTNIYINEPEAKGYFTARDFSELEKIMIEKGLTKCKIAMTLYGEEALSDEVTLNEIKLLKERCKA